MNNSKRICYTCGAEYDYCPGCARSAGQPEWMLLWDNEECKDVFEILSAYNMGLADGKDVKEVLDNYGATPSKYTPKIRKQLQKAIQPEQKVVDIDSKEKE